MSQPVYETRFAHNLSALRAFAAREGHCRVPARHIEATATGPVDLGRWVAYLRARHRSGRLSAGYETQLATVPGWNYEPWRAGPAPRATRNNEIRALRRAGVSLSTIANTYGLSKQRAYQLTVGVVIDGVQ